MTAGRSGGSRRRPGWSSRPPAPCWRRLPPAASRPGLSAVRSATRCSVSRSPNRPLGPTSTSPPRHRPSGSSNCCSKGGIKVVPTGLAHGTVTAVVAAVAFRDHDLAPRRRDLWPPRARRLRRRLGSRCRPARLHDQRDLSRSRRHDPRPGRRFGRSAGPARPLCRRSRHAHRRGCVAAAALLPLRGAVRHRRRRSRRAPPAAPPAHLLPTLSAERVAQELVKLLETPDPTAALPMMREDGVLAVALPEARRLDRLQRMIAIEPEPDPLRRLAALIEVDADGGAALAARLRFPNAWRDRLLSLAPPWPSFRQGDRARAAANPLRTRRRTLSRYRSAVAAAGAMPQDRLTELLALARRLDAAGFSRSPGAT